ncbi:MAG: hypothetical protein ACD_46C00362G0002 [uncultured bacterium]|nr:MAG: hypothetical protein ACD_46C00362G0002 [uncultured bacterium]
MPLFTHLFKRMKDQVLTPANKKYSPLKNVKEKSSSESEEDSSYSPGFLSNKWEMYSSSSPENTEYSSSEDEFADEGKEFFNKWGVWGTANDYPEWKKFINDFDHYLTEQTFRRLYLELTAKLLNKKIESQDYYSHETTTTPISEKEKTIWTCENILKLCIDKKDLFKNKLIDPDTCLEKLHKDCLVHLNNFNIVKHPLNKEELDNLVKSTKVKISNHILSSSNSPSPTSSPDETSSMFKMNK